MYRMKIPYLSFKNRFSAFLFPPSAGLPCFCYKTLLYSRVLIGAWDMIALPHQNISAFDGTNVSPNTFRCLDLS